MRPETDQHMDRGEMGGVEVRSAAVLVHDQRIEQDQRPRLMAEGAEPRRIQDIGAVAKIVRQDEVVVQQEDHGQRAVAQSRSANR